MSLADPCFLNSFWDDVPVNRSRHPKASLAASQAAHVTGSGVASSSNGCRHGSLVELQRAERHRTLFLGSWKQLLGQIKMDHGDHTVDISRHFADTLDASYLGGC